jgi:hypothetical protein
MAMLHAISPQSVPIPRATRRRRWISYAACVWSILFAVPHIWWALGISAGFPGGDASHRLFMSSAWRYIYDLIVIVLCALAIPITLTLLRPPHQVIRRWLLYAAAWIACGMLTLRGVAGLVVDGASDPVWWPTFLIGGVLFGSVARLAWATKTATPEEHSG